MKHTRTPWKAVIREARPGSYGTGTRIIAAIVAEDQVIAHFVPNRRQALNARHTCICVNACEGINPEAIRELIEAARREIVCACSESYTSRGLADPTCVKHSLAADTADALTKLKEEKE